MRAYQKFVMLVVGSVSCCFVVVGGGDDAATAAGLMHIEPTDQFEPIETPLTVYLLKYLEVLVYCPGAPTRRWAAWQLDVRLARSGQVPANYISHTVYYISRYT